MYHCYLQTTRPPWQHTNDTRLVTLRGTAGPEAANTSSAPAQETSDQQGGAADLGPKYRNLNLQKIQRGVAEPVPDTQGFQQADHLSLLPASRPPLCVADEHYMPTLLASYGLDQQVCGMRQAALFCAVPHVSLNLWRMHSIL